MNSAIGVGVRLAVGVPVLTLLAVVVYFVGVGSIAVFGPPGGVGPGEVGVIDRLLTGVLVSAGVLVLGGVGGVVAYGIGDLALERLDDLRTP